MWGIALAGVAVVLGAFGAHGLKEKLSVQQIETFKTGVLYQFIHCFALIITSFLLQNSSNTTHFVRAGQAFLMGIFCFSGSLYLFTLIAAFDVLPDGRSPSGLGLITPLGGVFFIVGWVFLWLGVSKIPSES